MIKEYIASAASLEEARELAKKMLGAPEEADVKLEVISAGKKKTLGLFGGAPAKVRAYYEVPEPAPEKKPAPKPEKKSAPEKKNAPEKKSSPEKKSAPKAAEKNEKINAEPLPSFDDEPGEPVDDAVSRYLTEVIGLMGVKDFSITARKSEKNMIYTISGDSEEQGILIGRRGETLDALQYLSRLVANVTGEDHDRVALNVGNYRQKREVSLRALAKRSSAQVLKYGKNVSLDPMNPYERRIVHTAVQEIEGVHSFSVGSDASRRVIIALDDGVQPTHAGKGGGYGGGRDRGGRGGKGRYNDRGGKGGYGKKDDAPAAPARAPKSDVEGVALYTKYEVRKDDEE
ncbi:MAG: KH domain-containing protein [Clostridia bacterium]|nr:KH domain-containing protein [Clostridia bacterium]